MRAALVAGFLLAFLVASADARATVVSCGQVITEDTRLANDLLDCPGDGLVVGADGIHIDLGGHVIDGASATVATVGIDNSAGYDGVRIVNGRIQQFASAITLVGTTQNLVRHLAISDGGIFVDGFARLDSSQNRIERNVFSGGGIQLRGSTENRIRRNQLTGGSIDLRFSSSDNRVYWNDIRHSVDGVVIFHTSNRNQVARNTLVGNTGSTIAIASSSGTSVRRNYLAGNATGFIIFESFRGEPPSDSTLILENHIFGNGFDGVFVYGPSEFMGVPVPGATGTRIIGNVVSENVDDGLDVRSSGTTITRNSADRNGDLGIDAVAGVTDGGGNRAAENGNPAQCVNVECAD